MQFVKLGYCLKYKITNLQAIMRLHKINLQAIMRLHKIKNSKHKWTHHIQNTSQLSTHLLDPYIHNIKKSNHIQIVHSPHTHTHNMV